MTDDARTRLLAEVDANLRADLHVTLERIDEHFIETAAAIAESDATRDVLIALCELLAANTAQLKRQIAANKAEVAKLRRGRLRLIVSEPTNKGA
jgi:hypothetical protein